MYGLIRRAFFGRSPQEQGLWHAMALILVLYLVHFTLYSFWVIEDAAISYAFANNWASGHGFVANPGGTPVEGFSNPSWTILLGVLAHFGASIWVSAKILGGTLGALTLIIASRWSRQMMPNAKPLWYAVAPLTLALSPQFVLWCASGLENPLFMAMTAIGATALIDELRSGLRSTWRSALSFSVVALTRPDGAIIAVIAGIYALVVAGRTLSWRQTLSGSVRWLSWALMPVLLWQLYRRTYFGWDLPNTYYAKLVLEDRFALFGWNVKGWLYLRNYGLASATAFLLPLYVMGQTGFRGWRRYLGVGLALLLVVVLVGSADWSFDAKLTKPWRMALVGTIAATLITPVIVGLGRRGPRTLAGLFCLSTIMFILYSGGDWMKGYRWMSLMVVPMAVLFADALHQLHCALSKQKYKRQFTAFVLLIPSIASVIGIGVFLSRPETTPFDVHRRVKFMQSVQDRLHLDRPSLLEVDMGAHMWWSGFEVVDMAGLVNVPIAHSGYDRTFIRDYIFATKMPTFAHVHGSWATKTKMTTHAGWRQYVDVGAYPISPWTEHPGSHVARTLIAVKKYDADPEHTVKFSNGFVLKNWLIPSPTTSPGGLLFVELGMTRSRRTAHTRLYLTLASDDTHHVWEIPPGYDWLDQTQWQVRETIIGRHTLTIPPDFPLGHYTLSFMAIDESGVIEVISGHNAWEAAVNVTTADVVDSIVASKRNQTMTAAQNGDCTKAQTLFDQARRHFPFRSTAATNLHTTLGPDIATCLALSSNVSVDDLAQARWYDPKNTDVIAIGQQHAQSTLQNAEDATNAKRRLSLLSTAAAFDPSDPHLRRLVESAREDAYRVE